MTEDLNRGVSEDTGAEVEGAEGASSTGEMATGEMATGEMSAGASFTGTEGGEQLIGQASVVVARPEPGQIVQISAEPGQTYVLDFDPSQARALVDGDNLIPPSRTAPRSSSRTWSTWRSWRTAPASSTPART